jgi:flagellar basal body-associated protein FliL
VQYQSANNPYSQGYDNYNQSAGYLPSKKKGMSKWIKIGVPVLILVIAGAVVGGILGSRSNKSGGGGNGSSPASASSAVANKDAVGVFATATDVYGQPQYPTAVSRLVSFRISYAN